MYPVCRLVICVIRVCSSCTLHPEYHAASNVNAENEDYLNIFDPFFLLGKNSSSCFMMALCE